MRKPINDDDLDPNQLKDGERLRVPMKFMDGLSRSVAKHVSKRGHMTDANGQGGLALNKPGFREFSDKTVGAQFVNDAARAAQEAYALDNYYKINAWKDALLDEDDDDALYAAKQEAKSSDCYADYEAEMRDAWRRG